MAKRLFGLEEETTENEWLEGTNIQAVEQVNIEKTQKIICIITKRVHFAYFINSFHYMIRCF